MRRYRYTSGSLNSREPAGRYTRDQPVEPSDNGQIPVHGSYGTLLFDPRWKNKRASIMNRDAHACVICKSDEALQVHHRQYHFIKSANGFRMPWDYPDQLLITLCKNCHQRGHSKFKVPTLIL